MQKFSLLHLPPYHFAYPLDGLKEVIKDQPINSIPKAPTYIKGLLPMRGHLYTIFSLPTLLEFRVSETPLSYTILLHHPKERFGFQVESIDIIEAPQMVHLSPSSISFAHWTKGVFMSTYGETFILNFAPLFHTKNRSL